MEDPILSAYWKTHPESFFEVMTSLEKIDARSVNYTRDTKIVFWRLAGKIADSGQTQLTHQQLYDHLKKSVGFDKV